MYRPPYRPDQDWSTFSDLLPDALKLGTVGLRFCLAVFPAIPPAHGSNDSQAPQADRSDRCAEGIDVARPARSTGRSASCRIRYGGYAARTFGKAEFPCA
jgi:hypothetical protein